MAGQRVTDQLDVVLDRGELAPLIMHHGPQAVVENAFDVGDIALQRADRGGMLFGAHAREVLTCSGSRAGGPVSFPLGKQPAKMKIKEWPCRRPCTGRVLRRWNVRSSRIGCGGHVGRRRG